MPIGKAKYKDQKWKTARGNWKPQAGCNVDVHTSPALDRRRPTKEGPELRPGDSNYSVCPDTPVAKVLCYVSGVLGYGHKH